MQSDLVIVSLRLKNGGKVVKCWQQAPVVVGDDEGDDDEESQKEIFNPAGLSDGNKEHIDEQLKEPGSRNTIKICYQKLVGGIRNKL